MEKIKNILNNKCIKLICGAANENIKEIEKLAFVFSKAGFNMIDVSAKCDVISAAKRGLKKAGKENDTSVCVSVGLKDDIHLSKAVINRQKCSLCKKCIEICSQNALFSEDEKIFVEEKKCIGCMKCAQVCENQAILNEHKYKTPYEMLLHVLSEDIDCVEFHCTSADESLILDSFNKIKSIYNGLISICLDRSKLGDDRIINLLLKMTKETDNIMIQADGKPMSGGCDDYNSTLQTVAFAQLLRSSNINTYLVLSGGTNSKTTKLAKECDLNIEGVALGSYARKLVKDFVNQEDIFENETAQNNAVKLAKELYDSIKKYL